MSVDLNKGATVELVKTLSDDLRTKVDGTKHSSAGAMARAIETEVAGLKTNFVNYNLFNKRTASIISVMGNSNGGLVSGGGVSSVAIPCEPSTQYTLSFWGGNRKLLWETEVYPAVGGTWLVNDGELSVTSESIDGQNRYKKTITTSANTHYLLLYFYTNSTGAEDVPNTVQLELGDTMHEYGAFDMPQLQVMTSQIFEDEKVANVLGYRALGALNKGYICLVADDGTSDIADVSFAIAQNKNVPITFALWSTSACVTDSTLRTQLLDMVANHGCSVAQHGEGYFTNYTTDQLIEYLESEKSAFDALGITTKGLVYPNHAHNGVVRAVCGSMYEVCCTGGASTNKDHVDEHDTLGTRSNQFALYRVSTYSTTEATLKESCDYAYDNNKLLIIWWHDNDVAGESAQLTKINNVIDYAKTKGLEFITVGDIPYLSGEVNPSKQDFDNINLTGDTNKHRVVCGAVRNSGNGWGFIVDSQHQADMNAVTVSANENGQLVIDFGITAKKIVSFIIAPDENFAKLGYFIGASVGTTRAICEIYQASPSAVSATIYYDSATDAFKLDKTNGVTSAEWDAQNGRMIINHNSVDNNAPMISLTPFRFGKDFSVPQTWTATTTQVKFFDLATGNPDNTKSNKMELTFCRADVKKFAYNLVDANNINNSYANFWFMGIFEV